MEYRYSQRSSLPVKFRKFHTAVVKKKTNVSVKQRPGLTSLFSYRTEKHIFAIEDASNARLDLKNICAAIAISKSM